MSSEEFWAGVSQNPCCESKVESNFSDQSQIPLQNSLIACINHPGLQQKHFLFTWNVRISVSLNILWKVKIW